MPWKSAEEYGVGEDPRQSLELSAHSRAVVLVAVGDDQSPGCGGLVGGDRGDLRFERERAREGLGDPGHGGLVRGVACQRGGERRDGEDLAVYVWIRRDRPFRTGAQRDGPVGGIGQRGVRLLAIAMVGAPWATGFGDDRHDIRRRSRLADPYHQGIVSDVRRRSSAAEGDDRGRPKPDRQSVANAQDVLGVDRGVVATCRERRSRHAQPDAPGMDAA